MGERERIRALMADVFGMPIGRLVDPLTPGSVPEWTSPRHLELMLALEERLGVEVPVEWMPELVSLDAIEEFVTAATQAAAPSTPRAL